MDGGGDITEKYNGYGQETVERDLYRSESARYKVHCGETLQMWNGENGREGGGGERGLLWELKTANTRGNEVKQKKINKIFSTYVVNTKWI
jgi:hypothetical protein